MKLDDKGRCCGRKPLVYKRPPHLFCSRCDRSYNPESHEQIENWAWMPGRYGFQRRPHGPVTVGRIPVLEEDFF